MRSVTNKLTYGNTLPASALIGQRNPIPQRAESHFRGVKMLNYIWRPRPHESNQPTNLKSCHCSFVFIPLHAHTSLFSLSVVPSRSILSSCKYDRANSNGGALSEATQSSLTCCHCFSNLDRKLLPLLLSDLIRASSRIHSASAKGFTAWGLCRLAGLGNKQWKWKG